MDQQQSKREVQIVNDIVKQQFNIEDSEIGQYLEQNQIQQNFIKYTQEKQKNLENSNTDLDVLVDYQNQKLAIIMDNQKKLYNKLLWINITSDQIYKDQKPQNLLKDSNNLQTVKDLQIQTTKVTGYAQNLKKRLDLIEENLDRYFYEFLKQNKEKLTSLESNQIIKK